MLGSSQINLQIDLALSKNALMLAPQNLKIMKMEFYGIKISDVTKPCDTQKRIESNKLINSINLLQDEDYDCTSLNVWSYRKGGDCRDGVSLKYGNMCNGFPFSIGGVTFANSECAYVAGAYARKDPDCIRIQKMISEETNGQICKRLYRLLPEYTRFIREDFYEYNVQYMMLVVWKKATLNKSFGDLLRNIPIDAHVVENTSLHRGSTAGYWGAKNKELMAAREVVENEIEKSGQFRYKYQREEAKMLAANSINDIGHFIGKNVMGKIIKMCSLSLIYNTIPPIDFDLFRRKELFFCGRPLLEFAVE
jgi:hypothetical protein